MVGKSTWKSLDGKSYLGKFTTYIRDKINMTGINLTSTGDIDGSMG